MRYQMSHAACSFAFVALLWLCPAALGELPARYELPRWWYGQGSLVVVVDVSDVECNYYEMAGRAQEIIRLAKRSKAGCLVVKDDNLPWRGEPRTTQYDYQPATSYLRIAAYLGLRTGIVLPAIDADPSEEQQSQWIARVVELVDRDDYDYIALPDQTSVEAFLASPAEEIYRRELSEEERRNGWHPQRGYLRSQWRVLRLPMSASGKDSLAAAAVEVTEATGRESQQPHRFRQSRRPKELEVTLQEAEGASRRFLDQLIDAASDSSNTRVRLRLKVQKDGSIDERAFATL